MKIHNPLIEIENAHFSFGDHQVLKEITLHLAQGTLCCLMGQNGCGKSTLLDAILGVNVLQKGRILIEGQLVGSYKPEKLARKISYVPQGHNRSFPYKVRQIVLMGRTAYIGGFGSPSEEDKQITKDAMREVGIDHLADRPYTQISGGEMQMVVLARALVQSTPVIIMDEPTAHLDFYNELLFMETVANLVKSKGKTVILATHSPNHAFYFERHQIPVHVALMHEGKIYDEGSPSDVLHAENIKRIYRIEAQIFEEPSGKTAKQIIPMKTLRASGKEPHEHES